jgi:hypothetical protein
MAAIVDVENPIEVRKAGLRALNTALGYDVTRAFMAQSFGGEGDFTKERHEQPEPGFEELTAQLRQIDAEMRAAGRYNE